MTQDPPTIIDGTMINDELDILEIRLQELCDLVDFFVLIESSTTFSGKPRKSVRDKLFTEERFKKFTSKIKLYTIDVPSKIDNVWEREFYQRNQTTEVFKKDFPTANYYIISDLDEIPKASSIQKAIEDNVQFPIRCNSFMCHYYLNFKLKDIMWGGPTVWKGLPPLSAQKVRETQNVNNISNAGWHFSYIGDIKTLQNKMQSYSHTEFSKLSENEIKQFMKDKQVFYRKELQIDVVPIDSSYPKFIQDNKEYFSRFIFKE